MEKKIKRFIISYNAGNDQENEEDPTQSDNKIYYKIALNQNSLVVGLPKNSEQWKRMYILENTLIWEQKIPR